MSKMSSLILKAGGVIIRDRKLLVTRSWNETFFIAPGGKLEEGETAKQALVRELKEELGITVAERDLKEFGTFSGRAASDETKTIQMKVFIVESWRGEPHPSHEIAEISWIDSSIPAGWNIGSIFEHDVLPRLKAQNLIN